MLASEQAAQDLLAILQREHRALAQNDLDALAQAAGEKQQALRTLETAVPRDALSASNAPLQRLLRDCARQNDVNGRMVEIRRRTTKQALGILQGRQTTSADLYGPGGEANIAPESHFLARG